MSEPKTYWNDPTPRYMTYYLACDSCRSDVKISVERYPHGPEGLAACPVCGSRGQQYRKEFDL